MVVVDVGIPVDGYGDWDGPVHHHHQPVESEPSQAGDVIHQNSPSDGQSHLSWLTIVWAKISPEVLQDDGNMTESIQTVHQNKTVDISPFERDEFSRISNVILMTVENHMLPYDWIVDYQNDDNRQNGETSQTIIRFIVDIWAVYKVDLEYVRPCDGKFHK